MLPLESVSHWIFSQSKIHPSLCGYEAVSGALSGGNKVVLIPLLFCKLSYIHIHDDVCMLEYNPTSSRLYRSIPRVFF